MRNAESAHCNHVLSFQFYSTFYATNSNVPIPYIRTLCDRLYRLSMHCQGTSRSHALPYFPPSSSYSWPLLCWKGEGKLSNFLDIFASYFLFLLLLEWNVLPAAQFNQAVSTTAMLCRCTARYRDTPFTSHPLPFCPSVSTRISWEDLRLQFLA